MGQINAEKNFAGIEDYVLSHQQLMVMVVDISWKPIVRQHGMEEVGIAVTFVQDSQSLSTKGVLRRLHFLKNFSQTKLFRVIKGSVFDVAMDMRSGSDTYGKWCDIELNEENKKQFLIPRGFAHGFLVLS
jgi:dTDP-4-dehydrorhamnose 3,5-epimerase